MKSPFRVKKVRKRSSRSRDVEIRPGASRGVESLVREATVKRYRDVPSETGMIPTDPPLVEERLQLSAHLQVFDWTAEFESGVCTGASNLKSERGDMPHLKITKLEEDVLTAIVLLSQHLSHPIESYYGIIGRIRSQKFGIPGRGRGETTKGFIDGHQTRVTPKWESRKEYE